MLRFLRIGHLAVIDSVEVEFDAGLNVLTGETGAGKSILVEAVGLLMGGRASPELVRTGEETATVEALFETGSDEVLLRREVTAQGRSRAFVDGALTTAGVMRDRSSGLVELHGQHEYHVLRDPSTHLAILDAFGLPAEHLAAVQSACVTMQGATADLATARTLASERDTRRELAEFQLGELKRANLDPAAPDEDSTLASTREVLASAERIERLCAEGFSALYESDTAVLASLSGVWRRVGELATFDPSFTPYLEQRDAIKAQLDDLAQTLRRYADGIDASPARLQHVEERLALLERLKRKYGPTLADVLARQNALGRELSELERSEERIAELEALLASERDRYVQAAETVSRLRRKLAVAFAQQIESQLAELAMDSTRFEVRFNADPLPESLWSLDGIDQAEFFVSPDPGEDLRPLARIVSGGELSRIMLAVKTLTTTLRHGANSGEDEGARPSVIFDEVDAGIGGRVADVVGSKLRGLGTRFQVLCITHLPQIAACADTHFRIEKSVEGGRTSTRVTRLDEPARVEELARMLGGRAVTDGIRRSAREMLETRRRVATSEDRPKGESERTKAKVRRRTS